MSFVVACQCGKQFKVADENRGQKARCPGCGTKLTLEPALQLPVTPPPPPPASAPSADEGSGDDPFNSVDWEAAAAMEQNATVDQNAGPRAVGGPPPVPAAKRAANQKACPSCGSLISAYAMRCEHCGANLAGGPAAPGAYKKEKLAYAAGGDDSDLSGLDWVLCILCSGIGCIVGIVYLVQGKPKGGKMIGISLLVSFIGGAIKAYLKQKGADTP